MGNNLLLHKGLTVVEAGESKGQIIGNDSFIVEIGRHIKFDPSALDTLDVQGYAAIHYDLLLLCSAIELADRRWKRPSGWRRELNVSLPVIDLPTWQKPEVTIALRRALRHLTGDNWHFQFVQAKGLPRIGSSQRPLDFGRRNFAIAYSEGLDSRAVSALTGTSVEALCVRVVNRRHRYRKGDTAFIQIPFNMKGYRGRESSFRSRAFIFSVLTSLASQLCGVSRIVVPESGQGALGPVLLPLHKIYPDYRNHPTFFRKIEPFIEAVLGHRVSFEQPRLWFTKGQTIAAFLDIDGKSKSHLTDTHSCWQTRRVVNVGGRKQCGLCAACILRRLSLHKAGIEEPTGTYIVADLTVHTVDEALSVIPNKVDRDIMIEYGSVGARHMQHLSDLADRPDNDLRGYASEIAVATRQPNDVVISRLRQLLVTHADEWRAFCAAQGEQSFLHTWTDGGRYD